MLAIGRTDDLLPSFSSSGFSTQTANDNLAAQPALKQPEYFANH